MLILRDKNSVLTLCIIYVAVFFGQGSTYIICTIETPCDANLFLPFASIHSFNSTCYLKGGYAVDKIWITIEGDASGASYDIGARNAIETFWSRPSFGNVRVSLVTVLAREMRLNFFEVDQALEMLRVPLVTMLAWEMRLKTFWSRPSFGDVALETQNVEEGHLAKGQKGHPSNSTFLLIAINRTVFAEWKKEGRSTKFCLNYFNFSPRDSVIIFQSLVMILPRFFDFERP